MNLNDAFQIILSLFLLAVSIWISWRLVKKTGNPGVTSLILFIPLINLAFILFMALSQWPIEKELEEYKKHFGKLPENEQSEAASADPAGTEGEAILGDSEPCPHCSAPIPPGAEKCPACGYPDQTGFSFP